MGNVQAAIVDTSWNQSVDRVWPSNDIFKLIDIFA